MNILVTGATGFLGKFLCEALHKHGHCVTRLHSKNCDLRYQTSLHAFNSISFDRIYHLAAWTQAGDFCLHHPGEQWIINQEINTHVLTWWQAFQPQAKLICIGTSCSYDPSLPLTEENYLKGLPIESLFTYAMTKRMLLCGLQALEKQFGLKYLYVIPSTLYGPGYHKDGRQMHFIFDLIRKILRGKNDREPVSLWGDGYQKRELIHVNDFICSLLQLSDLVVNTHVNIGGGEEYSIRSFADIICKHVGYPCDQIHYDLKKYVGARSKLLSIQYLRSLLPDFTLTPLENGLHQTIEWMKKE